MNDFLTEADQIIVDAWGQPIEDLETTAVRRPVEDPLLRSVMHVRQSMSCAYKDVKTHQARLHQLARPGNITPHDLNRITSSATALRLATAEAESALRTIGFLADSRQLAGQASPSRPGHSRTAPAPDTSGPSASRPAAAPAPAARKKRPTRR